MIIRIAKLSSKKSSEMPTVEEPVQLPDLEGAVLHHGCPALPKKL